MSQPLPAAAPGWASLLRDRWLLFGLLALGASAGLFLLGSGAPAPFFEHLQLAGVSMAVVYLLSAARRVGHLRGRIFWRSTAVAMLAWVGGLAYGLSPLASRLSYLVADGIWAFYYLAAFFAVTGRLLPRLPRLDPSAALELLGRVAFALFLVQYLVVAGLRTGGHPGAEPVALGWAGQSSENPAGLVYVVLDVLLAVSFVSAALRSQTRYWRSVHGCWSLAASMWAVADFLEWLDLTGRLPLPLDSPVWLLTTGGLGLVLVAARLPAGEERERARPGANARASGLVFAPVAALAVCVPLLHLLLNRFGLVDEATHRAREPIVIVAILLLAAIAVGQRVLSDRLARRLDAELQSADRRLQHAQRMEALGRLAGGVAHEFNNQLAVILGFSSMLREMRPADEEVAGCVSPIMEAAKKAATLTDQMLAFGKRPQNLPVDLDVSEIVQGMAPSLERLLGEEIELRLALEAKLPAVRGAPSQIEQIVAHLALNARDAMADGGTLRIETRRILDRRGPLVRLSFVDSGVGMDESTRQHAFDPFFTTKEVGKGAGLGLSAVYGIVQQLGGRIEVESEPGRGSTFVVHLPAVPPTAVSEPPAENLRAELARR